MINLTLRNLTSSIFKSLPTYKEFSKFNDMFMLNVMEKPLNKKWVKIIYYPFAIIGLVATYSVIYLLIDASAHSDRTSYKRSDKYRKVIKEGILFDTIEYHER